jgi:hypothetical protein
MRDKRPQSNNTEYGDTKALFCLELKNKLEDGGSMLLQNVGIYIQIHTALLSRRPISTSEGSGSFEEHLESIEKTRLISVKNVTQMKVCVTDATSVCLPSDSVYCIVWDNVTRDLVAHPLGSVKQDQRVNAVTPFPIYRVKRRFNMLKTLRLLFSYAGYSRIDILLAEHAVNSYGHTILSHIYIVLVGLNLA